MRLSPRERVEVSLHLRDDVLHGGVVGLGRGRQVTFEARGVRFELVVLERPELLVSVRGALHHGRAPANGQLQLHDLLQVSLVVALCVARWFGASAVCVVWPWPPPFTSNA